MGKNRIIIGVVAILVVISIAAAIVVNRSAPAEDRDVIKIGAILPLTGSTSYIGNSIKRGLEIAEEKYGDKVQVIYADMEGRNEKAISEKRRLKTLENACIFISVFSGTTKTLAPEFDGTNDLLFATCVSNANITLISDHLFRLFLNADGDARIMARYAIDQLKKRNFAVLYVNDDFGRDYCFAFEDEVKKNGGSIITKVSFEKGEMDFRDSLMQLKQFSNKCDGVYLLGYDNNFGIILKQYAENNIQIPILSMATIGAPMVADIIGAYMNKLPPIYYTNTLLDSKTNQNKEKTEFVKMYEKRFNESPNYFAAFAYDIIVCIANADNSDLKQSLLTKEFHGVMGDIRFSQDRDAEFPVAIEKLN